MSYELHVWGRISELPSFDADCLVAMMYLELADGPTEEYRIVPSSNPLISSDCTIFDFIFFFTKKGVLIDA